MALRREVYATFTFTYFILHLLCLQRSEVLEQRHEVATIT